MNERKYFIDWIRVLLFSAYTFSLRHAICNVWLGNKTPPNKGGSPVYLVAASMAFAAVFLYLVWVSIMR